MNKELDKLTPMQKSAYVLKKLRAKLDKLEKKQSEPVAIIGMSCRFPGASNCDEYWQLLHNGEDAVTEIPEDRWPINDFYNPDPAAPGKMNARCGGFVSNIDMFDADFFGISLREAKKMDPQQRMLLEVSWEALEDAGQSPKKLMESQTGVYIGFNQNDYALMLLKGNYNNLDHYTTTGNGYCFGAGRIAYTFGFSGPVMSIDTACSSSMIALHQACNGLKANDCNMALAGGIQLNILPDFHILLSQTHTLSPSGACKTFDADADGLVLGEGCGIVVLKRLSDALSNNDNILALITGTGVNHGGPASGITVPNEIAQENVIRQALKNARLKPSDIHFIETHGTGTTLGDPIEFNAIDAVFGDRSMDDPLILGSVKTNIGHLDAASGVAGLIKTVLSLQHNEIPSNLHFKTPSPKIDWSKGNIKVASENIPWPRGEQRRIAGVSSFGISGTNSHVIIEGLSEIEAKEETFKRPVHIFTLSAKTEKALHDLLINYCEYLKTNPQEKIENICYTTNTGRDHFNFRISVTVNSISQLQKKLDFYLKNSDLASGDADGLFSKEQSTRQLKITFYFPEENKNFIGIGKELFHTQPIFKKSIDLCHNIVQDTYNISLNSILYNKIDSLPKKHIQLAAFSIEFALSELWQSLGIKPSNLMGHGVGEIAAACIAGKYTLEQAIETILNETTPDNVSEAQIKIISGKKTDYIQTIKDHKSEYIIELGSTVSNDQLNGIKNLSAFEKNRDEWETLVNNLSLLYIEGADINWENFDNEYIRKRVQLPSYQFQRKRYWVDKEIIEPVPVHAPVHVPVHVKDSTSVKKTIKQSNTVQPNIDQSDMNQLKTNQSNPVLPRIMAQQLKAASDSIATVVFQQLKFLSNKPVQEAQVEKSIIKENVDLKKNPGLNKKKNVELETKIEQHSKNKTTIESKISLDCFENHLVLLSGKTEEELENETKKLIKNLKTDDIDLQQIFKELRKKQALKHRRMLVCQNKDDCLEILEKNDKKRVYTSIYKKAHRPIAFLFPGVGDHYINMSKRLYDLEPVYRNQFDKCCDILLPHLEEDLRNVLFVKQDKDKSKPSQGGLDLRRMLQRGPVDKNTQKLNLPVFSHTGVFVVNYSLANLWKSWGIKPQATIGYSIGEYVSACLSEVISLEDVLPFIAKRAKMIQDLPEGAMLAVPLSETEILPHLDESHSIAILSTDSQCVIAGTPESIDDLEKTLTDQGILFRRLQNTHAVHSKLMEPIREPLTKMMRNINLKPPVIPYLSNVTGTWINEAQATDPHYWAQHTCQTARFIDGIGELLQTPGRIFLEVGPGQSLGSFVFQHSGFSNNQDCIVLPSLKTMYDGKTDDAFLLNTLGKLWLVGVYLVNFQEKDFGK